MARVAGTLQDELEPVGAEPGGHPLELGADRVAHSLAALPSALASRLDGWPRRLDFGLGLRGLVRRRLLGRLSGFPGPLAVLAVVGDVEAAAAEDQSRTARDLPGCRLAADRTLGPGLVGHLLELLEAVAFGALVLVGRHRRSLRVKRNQPCKLAELASWFKRVRRVGVVRQLIHHEGTKDTKALSTVQDTSYAVSEKFHIEVDEKSDGMFGQPEIGEQLCSVDREHSRDRLHLDDH